MINYGDKLKKVLVASGWSQEELASKLGISFVTLNRWVNGKATPRASAKERIDLVFANIFGSDDIDESEVIKTKQIALTNKLSAKQLVANREILECITVNLTYHSNGTEGSTMTEGDVEAVILDGQVLRNRSAIEQREAINHQAALNFLLDELNNYGNSFRFTPDLVRAVHLRMMNGIISDAGEYRNHGARIRGAYVPLANFMKISELLEDWCNVANKETKDKIMSLATLHAEFERIHPFSDGNGRTGRLLLFIQALQFGLVPPIIKKERRNAYYKYLELCQTGRASHPLEKVIADAIIETGDLIATIK